MQSVNKVTLMGNVGGDPEVRSTSAGKVATLSLATTRVWKNAGGEKQEKTQWHRLVAWNNKSRQLADLVEKYVRTGMPLYVEGEVEYKQWEDKEGQTRYMTEINVRDVIFLGTKDKDNEDASRLKAVSKAVPKSKALNLSEGDDDDIPF